MPTVSENTIGVNLQLVNRPGINPDSGPLFKTGTVVDGTDGGRYQYARATANIAADSTVVDITVVDGEYVAAATGGDAVSPPSEMAAGDFAFFKLA